MRIEGIPEEVALVTDFNQLREMMAFWIYPCVLCAGGKHRHYLLRRGFGPAVLDASQLWVVVEPFFIAEPKPACFPKNLVRAVVSPSVIRQGVIYRVVDPLMEKGDVNDMQRHHDEFEATLRSGGGKRRVRTRDDIEFGSDGLPVIRK